MQSNKIALITTGGTIASFANNAGEYTSGSLSINSVLPKELLQNLDIINLFSIDSCNMTSTKLLKLASTIQSLAKNDKYKAIIVTHGTDSMVESAFFVYLTHKSSKAVIFTGAMRSANAKDFDGIDNFKLAIASQDANGVFIAMGGKLLCASQSIKLDCNHLASFDIKASPNIEKGLFDIPQKLPKVSIIYSHAGDNYINPYADILIYAGLGNGSIPNGAKAKLCKMAKRGKIVIRSTVCTYGNVSKQASDDTLGFVSPGYFNPIQSKIVAMLAGQNTKAVLDKYAHNTH